MMQSPRYVELLYQLDLDINHVKEKLAEYILRIKKWPEQYLKQQTVTNKTQQSNGHAGCDVTKIVDIEENIWSPYYGFKGIQ